MNIYIFGNGNLSFADFRKYYEPVLERFADDADASFLLCDFRGVDALAMEFLKCRAANVGVLHVGERPRYLPDKFRTQVGNWNIKGGFTSDEQRDHDAIDSCTHFLAFDFNSDEKRKSGAQKNIERCLAMGKIQLSTL